MDYSDRDANGDTSTNTLIPRTDMIEGQIGEETNRCVKYREEVERMKTELQNMRALKATILDEMGDNSVTGKNYKTLEDMYERLGKRYGLARREITSLEEQLKKADMTIRDLEKELAGVRKDLQEEKKKTYGLEMDVIDLNKRVKTLEQEVVSLHADLDTVKEERDKYQRDWEALKDTDSSTPTSSEVSMRTPEDGSMTQSPAVAESSRNQASQVQVHPDERVDRDGSPPATITDSVAGTALARTPTGSSGKSSKWKPLGEVLQSNTKTREYDLVHPQGAVCLETRTKTVHVPEKHHRKKSDSRRKSSRASKESI
jgi:predicted  nucleic acid-binding Zn-ribbon protein